MQSHYRFRHRGTEYVSRYGMRWMSGGAKRERDGALPPAAGPRLALLLRVARISPRGLFGPCRRIRRIRRIRQSRLRLSRRFGCQPVSLGQCEPASNEHRVQAEARPLGEADGGGHHRGHRVAERQQPIFEAQPCTGTGAESGGDVFSTSIQTPYSLLKISRFVQSWLRWRRI
jgi:hypothetical protein